MATTKELLKDYQEASKNKHNNCECVEFQIHKYRNILRLRNAINERHLHPTSATYIVCDPIVREVYSADIPQCTVEHRLERYLRPLMEKDINPCVFNNRKRMGLDKALNHLIEGIYGTTNGFTQKNCWVVVSDISGYFPNALQNRMFIIMLRLINRSDYNEQLKDELRYLLRMSVFFNPRSAEMRSSSGDWNYLSPGKSLRNKPPGMGAAPGRVIMQMVMTYYHDEIIKWIMSINIPVTVYGDDVAFVVNQKQQFLQLVMPEYRKRMAEIGCKVHPNKFYFQHYTKGVRFCSQNIKMDRIYAGKRMSNNYYLAIKKWSNRPTLAKMPKMLSSLNSYIGTLKNRNGYAIILQGLDHLNSMWAKYVYLDGSSNTLRAYPEYSHNNLIKIINHINTYKYDNRREKTADIRATVGNHATEIRTVRNRLRGN